MEQRHRVCQIQGRGHEVLEGEAEVADLALPLQELGARHAVHIHQFPVRRVRKVEQLERSRHAGVSAGPKRDDLEGDMRHHARQDGPGVRLGLEQPRDEERAAPDGSRTLALPKPPAQPLQDHEIRIPPLVAKIKKCSPAFLATKSGAEHLLISRQGESRGAAPVMAYLATPWPPARPPRPKDSTSVP